MADTLFILKGFVLWLRPIIGFNESNLKLFSLPHLFFWIFFLWIKFSLISKAKFYIWIMIIFNINGEDEFNHKCLDIFKLQFNTIPVYHDFVLALNINPDGITQYQDIPFLPVEFFKSHPIIEDLAFADIVFSSSGTTRTQTSKHYVQDVQIY